MEWFWWLWNFFGFDFLDALAVLNGCGMFRNGFLGFLGYCSTGILWKAAGFIYTQIHVHGPSFAKCYDRLCAFRRFQVGGGPKMYTRRIAQGSVFPGGWDGEESPICVPRMHCPMRQQRQAWKPISLWTPSTDRIANRRTLWFFTGSVHIGSDDGPFILALLR